MGKYFGTDGFRGEANVNLTYEHAVKIGRFLGWYYGKRLDRKAKILIGKLAAVLLQITVMNVIIYIVSVMSVMIIGEAVPWRELNLLHLGYFLMQLEIACICFGISAFMRKGSMGTGLGLVAILYFMNLIANISKSVGFLNYLTPFGYCTGADIVSAGKLNLGMVTVGIVISAVGIIAAFVKYMHKDIQA